MADENESERDDERDEGEAEASAEARDDESTDRSEEREAERDAEQQAKEAEQLREDELPIAGLLGLERWVQFAFIAIAAFFVYVTDKLVTFTWEFWAEPDATMVTAIAVAVGLAGTFLLYQNDRVRDFATEVVTELADVTWPTRDETYYSTVVVISASLIAAFYTGLFDALWSAITDLVYRV
jgi:preprotein translocase subunit SecE